MGIPGLDKLIAESGLARQVDVDGDLPPGQTPKSSRVWVERLTAHDQLVINWVPSPHARGWNVWHSEAPFTVLTSPDVQRLNVDLVEIPMWVDTEVATRRNDFPYYSITEVDLAGNESFLGPAVTLGQSFGGEDRPLLSPIRIFREAVRRKSLILGRNAERVTYLVRKRAGLRDSCFDGRYQSVALSTCQNCYGVGFVGGYVVLHDVLVRVLSISEALKLQPQGLVFDQRPKGWLTEYPICRNGDVLIRRDGERMEVDKVDKTINQGVLLEQNFDLVTLPETHPIYKLDVSL